MNEDELGKEAWHTIVTLDQMLKELGYDEIQVDIKVSDADRQSAQHPDAAGTKPAVKENKKHLAKRGRKRSVSQPRQN